MNANRNYKIHINWQYKTRKISSWLLSLLFIYLEKYSPLPCTSNQLDYQYFRIIICIVMCDLVQSFYFFFVISCLFMDVADTTNFNKHSIDKITLQWFRKCLCETWDFSLHHNYVLIDSNIIKLRNHRKHIQRWNSPQNLSRNAKQGPTSL